ncbi:MAG TPA: aminotransferase class V-fold PLP-dependent enzyme [Bryobacteraceae bacterium]
MTWTLMNPGPVNVSESVRSAGFNSPDICHREPEYSDLQDAVRTSLLEVLGLSPDDYTSVLLTGSGTAAVEAMIASGVPRGGRLLVIRNGAYGERMQLIARAHGIECDTVDCSSTERPNIDDVRGRLDKNRYACLAVVHHETSTGLLNDLAPLAALCRERGVRILIDAVSSLGGEIVDFAAFQPDIVVSTANKCIQGLPGISFAIVRRACMEAIYEYPPRTLYLHLPEHHRAQGLRSTLFTPAVQTTFSFLAALRELSEETVAGRIARYGRMSAIVREGLESAGVRLVLPPALRSSTLTSAFLPDGISYKVLHDALKSERFVIYAGQGPQASALFRVATMGAVPEQEYHRFVHAVRRIVSG